MNPEIVNRVIQLVAREVSETADRIKLSSTLFRDLGVDGDDADELFSVFAKEFQVDLSDLNLSRHFGSEGFDPATTFFHLFLWLRDLIAGDSYQERIDKRFLPIYISDLVEAAEAGRWIKRVPEMTEEEKQRCR